MAPEPVHISTFVLSGRLQEAAPCLLVSKDANITDGSMTIHGTVLDLQLLA